MLQKKKNALSEIKCETPLIELHLYPTLISIRMKDMLGGNKSKYVPIQSTNMRYLQQNTL